MGERRWCDDSRDVGQGGVRALQFREYERQWVQ